MTTFQRSVFPLRRRSTDQGPTCASKGPAKRGRPQIALQTDLDEECECGVPLPASATWQRPAMRRTVTTPPASPNRQRAYTMGIDVRYLHDNGAVTPPSTPIKMQHARSRSGSSLSTSWDGLRRNNSTSSKGLSSGRPSLDGCGISSGRPSIEAPEQPTEPLQFPFWLSDYDVQTDERGQKKMLGSGYWSDVYSAVPCPLRSLDVEHGMSAQNQDRALTPPATPRHSRASSLRTVSLQPPRVYAVKTPAMRSAHGILAEECRILSHLWSRPGAEHYVVPFYGLDSRTQALVLRRMDGTLEEWAQRNLDCLSETDRASKLAHVFPRLALQLLNGLAWLHDQGCVHADIKPANVLVSTTDDDPVPHAVYSDFSSSILPSPSTVTSNPQQPPTKSKAPLGGGTWDFLDPVLLTSPTSSAPAPTPTSDLWSLAITLLVLVIGCSPFDGAGRNVYQRREMIRSGVPMGALGWGDDGVRNAKRLRGLGGGEMDRWFASVLIREEKKRVGLEAWRTMLAERLSC